MFTLTFGAVWLRASRCIQGHILGEPCWAWPMIRYSKAQSPLSAVRRTALCSVCHYSGGRFTPQPASFSLRCLSVCLYPLRFNTSALLCVSLSFFLQPTALSHDVLPGVYQYLCYSIIQVVHVLNYFTHVLARLKNGIFRV